MPHPWTLTVYGKDGQTVEQTVEVTNADGSVVLDDLNNDAVKFSVSGLPDDGRALLNANVTIQALDPYITQLDIVCESNKANDPAYANLQTSVTQSFTAKDFAIHGGSFKFYVPEKWGDEAESFMPCSFKFENLHTNYLDQTYYNHQYNGHGRDNLIGSEYYGLNDDKTAVVYHNVYDVSEPNAAPVDYTKKVSSVQCGTQPFYFSNADELDHDIASNDIRTLHQYPFSLETYANQKVIEHIDADGNTITTGQPAGTFEKLTMTKDEIKHAYLFVCDEPRYNIAPTRATEHRSYAYYNMELQLITKSFTPQAKWTKLYDEVQFANSSLKMPSQWGLEVSALVGQEEQSAGEKGYLTITEIDSLINDRINDATQEPNDRKQILYLDASKLSSIIYASNVGNGENKVEKLHKSLGANSLFILPLGNEESGDNYAHLTDQGNYYTNGDIVITDQQPFFSPYTIAVDASHQVKYSRKITPQTGYGSYTRGTVMLPFKLAIDDNGVHHGEDGCTFKLFTMKSTNALSLNKSDLNSGVEGYFDVVQSTQAIKETEANMPYFFEMVEESSTPQTIFMAAQKGGLLAASPTANNGTGKGIAQVLFTGPTSTGKIDNTTYTLTPTGSYFGAVIPKAEGAFYMAQGKFLNTLSLNTGLDGLNMLPFRTWYTCKTSSGQSPKLQMIHINFGDNPDIPTDIKTTQVGNGLHVVPGQGVVTILSDNNAEVDIYSINGTHVNHLSLNAGQEYTHYIPAGVYVINQQKIIVR